ncbi:SET domain-containing protein-lysine N-methyltransferase [Chlorobaculum sp. 24CR]|uniref:SET domain-containing protein n=1 Tax=Chlorobaculum sp. 24CR TaxID=2508878 RepID=UPI00100A7DEF|nr:SET domain-containing protein [Chlorobaculum sp. 24CR]RXK88343.1 SET domain-containing protein-lysine N-methyltransferase [Chlorobaculum sp. 24CR]
MTPLLFFVITIIFAAGAAAGAFLANTFRNKQERVCRGSVRIGPSTVAGRGAFALKAIKEGDIIERCPALEVTDKDIGGELLNYVFYGSAEDRRLIAMGYGMMFNHSSTPNVAYYREDGPTGTELILYALHSIAEGEEMYYNYGDDWWRTRGATCE